MGLGQIVRLRGVNAKHIEHTDGAHDTEGSEASGNDLLVILLALLGQVELSVVVKPQGRSTGLEGGELMLNSVVSGRPQDMRRRTRTGLPFSFLSSSVISSTCAM